MCIIFSMKQRPPVLNPSRGRNFLSQTLQYCCEVYHRWFIRYEGTDKREGCEADVEGQRSNTEEFDPH